METSTNKLTNSSHLNLAYDFIQGISKMNYEYIYRGELTKSIVSKILSVTLTNLDKEEDTQKLKKRIYFILVECLQNIAKHQEKTIYSVGNESAVIVIQKKDSRYYLTTANTIENEHIDKLTAKLEKINNMNSAELKSYYNEVIVNGEVSEKGGAGLGFISMARKTGNKLCYDFQKLDEHKSYFYLRAEIALKKDLDNDSKDQKYSFDKLKVMHKILIQEKIVLNFSGSFDNDNLLNLIPIVDAQVYSNVAVKKRMFSIIYEMLNNIVHYSEDYSSMQRSVGNNAGIFMLSSNNDKLSFTAGNYIHSSVVETLKRKLDFVNKSHDTELKEFHNKLSEYFQKGDVKQPDLSIIEMKLKSRNNLSYKFSEVSDVYSFFTIQTTIELNRQ